MASALLVVDVQRGMFEDPKSQPYQGAATVERIRGLLDRARGSGMPVFFVQHDGGEGDLLWAGGPGFGIVPELEPRTGEDVTVKRQDSAFEATDLEDKLRAAGIDELVICGMQTEFCVSAAVRAAVDRGFGVTLVGDAHTTYDQPGLPAERNIASTNAELGKVAGVKAAAEIPF